MKKKETKPKTAADLKEMFAAMQELEKTKGIPMESMLENIKRYFCTTFHLSFG